MSSYADIKLIECNRLQSIEAESGNQDQPGQFTCRLGDTVKLDAGDTVEVLNAFVSQDGCGGNNMEFKGSPLLNNNIDKPIVEKDFEYSRLKITYNVGYEAPLNREKIELETVMDWHKMKK